MAALHPFARWTIFNAVGALGIGVQLAVLALLVKGVGVGYLWATAAAVEAAVLHNFAWHQRWTWRDRPARSVRIVARRLAAFHLANGLVSIAGNLLLMAWLAGTLRLDPVLANVLAVAACSMVNFAAGTRLVFRAVPPAAVALVLAWPAAAIADPTPGAVRAWETYQAALDGRYAHAAGVDGDAAPFFAQDLHSPQGWRAQALSGEVTVRRLKGPEVGGGTIHHLVGAVFVPGVSLDRVLTRLLDQAGGEERFYDDVVASRLLSRDGDRVRVFLKLRRTAVLTVVYNTEHEVEYRRIAARRAVSRSIATRIAEVADAGTPREREKPPGTDRGFLWRLNAYWRYEETDGGVLIECESVSLSRDVPVLVRPVASPIVARIGRESLERTLRGLRSALAG